MSADASPDLRPEETEEAIRPVQEILEVELLEGLNALHRPLWGLLLSAFSGGLDIGFSLFLMAVMTTAGDQLPRPVRELLVAAMYAVGFLFVVLGRSELFTEHTTLAVLPVLSGHASWRALLRLWVAVYLANLAGAAGFAALTVLVGPGLGVIEPDALGTIARPVVEHPAGVIFLSAVLAGWLMGLMSWLVSASRDTTGQILVVAIVATAIGFCHLHHSVVGTVEVLAGVFAGQGITPADFGHFLLWTTLGNAVGGAFFVGVLKYSHGSRGGKFRQSGPSAGREGRPRPRQATGAR